MFSTEGKARRMAGLRELVTASAAADKALSPRRRGGCSSTSASAQAQASAAASQTASVIGLHGGFPPASSFPFVKLTATLRDGSVIEVDDPAEVRSFFLHFFFLFSSSSVFVSSSSVFTVGTKRWCRRGPCHRCHPRRLPLAAVAAKNLCAESEDFFFYFFFVRPPPLSLPLF